MACTPRSRSVLGLLSAALLVLAAAVTVAGDEPRQESPPPPTPTAVPGSLAAAAAGLRLRQPDDAAAGALVISDQNLKAVGAGAAVSQGSGATIAPAPEPDGPRPAVAPPAPAAANDLATRLLAQQSVVDDLTAQLRAMDEQLAAPPVDPHFPKVDQAPQFRAPGVVDSARGQRDALAAKLEGERATLEALRAEAATSGVTITKVPNEAATPTS